MHSTGNLSSNINRNNKIIKQINCSPQHCDREIVFGYTIVAGT